MTCCRRGAPGRLLRVKSLHVSKMLAPIMLFTLLLASAQAFSSSSDTGLLRSSYYRAQRTKYQDNQFTIGLYAQEQNVQQQQQPPQIANKKRVTYATTKVAAEIDATNYGKKKAVAITLPHNWAKVKAWSPPESFATTSINATTSNLPQNWALLQEYVVTAKSQQEEESSSTAAAVTHQASPPPPSPASSTTLEDQNAFEKEQKRAILPKIITEPATFTLGTVSPEHHVSPLGLVPPPDAVSMPHQAEQQIATRKEEQRETANKANDSNNVITTSAIDMKESLVDHQQTKIPTTIVSSLEQPESNENVFAPPTSDTDHKVDNHQAKIIPLLDNELSLDGGGATILDTATVEQDECAAAKKVDTSEDNGQILDFSSSPGAASTALEMPRNWAALKAWSRANVVSTTTTNGASSSSNNTNSSSPLLPRNWALLQDVVKAQQQSTSSIESSKTDLSGKQTIQLNGDDTTDNQEEDPMDDASPPDLKSSVVKQPKNNLDDGNDGTEVVEATQSSSFLVPSPPSIQPGVVASSADEEINAIGFTVAAGILWWSIFVDDEPTWQRALLGASAASYFIPGPIGKLARAIGAVLYETAASKPWQDKNSNDDDDDEESKSLEESTADEMGLSKPAQRPSTKAAMPLFFAATKPHEENISTILKPREETFETEIVAVTAAAAAPVNTKESASFVPATAQVIKSVQRNAGYWDKQNELTRRSMLEYRLTLQSQTETDKPKVLEESKFQTAPATKSQVVKEAPLPTMVVKDENTDMESTNQAKIYLDKLNELTHRSLLAYRLTLQAREQARRVYASSVDKMEVSQPAAQPSPPKRSRLVEAAAPLFFASTMSRQTANVAKPEEKVKSRRKATLRDEQVIDPLGARTTALETGAAAPPNTKGVQKKSMVPAVPGAGSRISKSGVKVEEQDYATTMSAKEKDSNKESTTRAVATEKQNEMSHRALLAYRLILEAKEQEQRATIQAVKKAINAILSPVTGTRTASAAAQLEEIYSILKAVTIETDTKQDGEAAKLEKINAILVARKAAMRNTKAISEAQLEQISAILAPRAASRTVAAPVSVVHLDIKKEASAPTSESLEESNKQNELTRRSLLEYRLHLQTLEHTQCTKEKETLEASKQNELTQRSLLHYRLTLQAVEQRLRARAQAQEESKRNELTRRSVLAYQLKLQAEERTRRAIAEAVEVSKQTTMQASRQHELTRRARLEYRLKLQAEERTQRARAQALKATKQNELTRRSLLAYQLKLQGAERTQRAIVEALEESKQKALKASKQNELTHRSLLAYQLKLQSEERTQRVIAKALKASKQNELTRRTILEYRLKLEAAERTQRDIAESEEVSKQKALEASKQNELSRHTILEYRLKLQAEERTQRAITEALKASKQNELTRRSLLEYRLKIQANERTQSAKAVEEHMVPTTTAPKVQFAQQTSPSTSVDLQQQLSQKQESRQVVVPASGKDQVMRDDSITTLGYVNASTTTVKPAQNLAEEKVEKTIVEKSDSNAPVSYQRQSEYPSADSNIEKKATTSSFVTKRTQSPPLDTAPSLKKTTNQDKPSILADRMQEDRSSPERRTPQAVVPKDIPQKTASLGNANQRAETKKPAASATIPNDTPQDAFGVNGGSTGKKTITSMSWVGKSQKTALDTNQNSSQKDGVGAQSSSKPVASDSSLDQRVTLRKKPIYGANPLHSDATKDTPFKQNTVDSAQSKLDDDEPKKPVTSPKKGGKTVVATHSQKPAAQVNASNQDKAVWTIAPSEPTIPAPSALFSPPIHTAALSDNEVKNQGDGEGVVAPQKVPKIDSNTKGAPQRNVVAAQDDISRISPKRTSSTLSPKNDSKQDESFTDRPKRTTATAKPGEGIAQKVQTSTPAMTTLAENMDPEHHPTNPVQEKPQQQQHPPVNTFDSPNGAISAMANDPTNQGKVASEQQKQPISISVVATQKYFDSMSSSQQHAFQPPPTDANQDQVTKESPTKPTTAKPVKGIPQQSQTALPAMTTAAWTVDPNQYRRFPSNPLQQQPQQQQQQAPAVTATKLYIPNGSAPTVSESNKQGKLASEQQKVPTAKVDGNKDGDSTSNSPQQHANVALPNVSNQGNLVAQSSPQTPTRTRQVQSTPQTSQTMTAMSTALPQTVGPKQEIFNRSSLVQRKQQQQQPPPPAQPTAAERWPTTTTRRKRRVTPNVEGSTSRILQLQPQQRQKPPLPLPPPPPSPFTTTATRRTNPRRLDTFDDDWKNIVGIKPLQPQSQQRQQQQQRQNPLSSQILASLNSAEGISGSSEKEAPLAAARPVQPSSSSNNSIGIDKKDPSGTRTTETRPPSSPDGAAPSTQAQEQVTVRAAASPLPQAAAATPPLSPQRVRQQQQPPPRYQNRWWESSGGPNRF